MGLRLLERLGRAMRFSPEGRAVRVWVQGRPGADETEVVGGTIVALRDDGAVLRLSPEAGPERSLLVVPHERGWGFEALWFSFIAVDVFELGSGEPVGAPVGAPVGRWFIRLGAPPPVPPGPS